MSTKSPDSGRFDQVVSAVTWKSTIRPLPRRPAVTSGVPSARRAQILSASAGVGLGQHLPGDGDLLGRGEPEERAPRLEGRDVLRRLPRQRAAEQAAAAPKLGRRQVVVAGGETGAREAQQDAAVVEELK